MKLSTALRISVVALVAVLATFATALPASSAQLEPRAVPLPSDDPFYTPPDNFASSAPGAVLRSRQVSAAFLGLLPAPVTAYQLLYRTTAIDGTPIATVTTVFKPLLLAHNDRFVSFATAEDSSAPQCAPSYTYRLGAKQASAIVAVENLIIQVYLAQGYLVNSPDYEGPDSAFSAGRLSGRGVLDSMRAVSTFGATIGLSTTKPAIVGVGYSGGAIATGWAAGLQSSYAPELNVKGWAAGGTPANLTSVVELIDGTTFAGFLPAAIAGLATKSAYAGQVVPLIDRIATDAGKAAIAYAQTHCAVEDLGNFAFQSIQSTKFQTLGDRFLYDPDVSDVLSKQTMGVVSSERPSVPILLYHSQQDEIIPYPAAAKLAQTWCDQGSVVTLHTLANGGHISGELFGVVEAGTFVNDAFAGKVPTACSQKTELNNLLNPLALGAAVEPILFKLIQLLATFGKNDENVKANPSGTLGSTVST